MITWAQACETVGYNVYAVGPPRVGVYYAYKDGVATKFPSRAEAMTHTLPSNIEEAFTKESITALAQFVECQRVLEHKARDYWHNALIEEYKCVNDITFGICYGIAFAMGDDRYLDKFAIDMGTAVTKALGIIAANNC